MPEVTSSFEAILEEHRQLRLRIEDLKAFLGEPRPEPGSPEARSWASKLSERLLQLHDRLCAHFQDEEGSGALNELARRHPWAFQNIERLQGEHETILRELRAILGASMVYAEGKTPASMHLRQWTRSVLEQVVRHEVEESDLITRSVAATERDEALATEFDHYAGVLPELCMEALVVPLRAVGWNEVPRLPVGSNVDDAVQLLQRGRGSCLLVTREDAPVGLVTERDLLMRVMGKVIDPSKTEIEEVMTRDLFTLGPDEPLAHALVLMDTGGFRHVLVAEGQEVHGVVTTRSILRYLTSLVPEEMRVLPSNQIPKERHGP